MLPFNSHRSIERELAGPGINPQGRYQYVDDVGGAYRNPPISFGPPDNVCTFYRLGEAQLGHFGRFSTPHVDMGNSLHTLFTSGASLLLID